jgi:hypothetical protein
MDHEDWLYYPLKRNYWFIRLMRDSSCYPQSANLNENAAFQSEILDVVFSAIMI